jgi:hypothetical protein
MHLIGINVWRGRIEQDGIEEATFSSVPSDSAVEASSQFVAR